MNLNDVLADVIAQLFVYIEMALGFDHKLLYLQRVTMAFGSTALLRVQHSA
jgi:hypothetical protein